MNRLLSERRIKERQEEQRLNEQLYSIHRDRAAGLFSTIAATSGEILYDWDFDNFYSKIDTSDPNIPVIAVDVKKYFKNRNQSLVNFRTTADKLGYQLLKADLGHFLMNRTTNDVATTADCESYLRSRPLQGEDSRLRDFQGQAGHDLYSGRDLNKRR